jgi:hypothetical protein
MEVPSIIDQTLTAIEKKLDATILLASECGHRRWGTASKSSGYEIKFVFVYNQWKKYVSIEEHQDSVKLNKGLYDFCGLDIRKALALFCSHDASILEMLYSTIIYRKSQSFVDLLMGFHGENGTIDTLRTHYYCKASGPAKWLAEMVRDDKYYGENCARTIKKMICFIKYSCLYLAATNCAPERTLQWPPIDALTELSRPYAPASVRAAALKTVDWRRNEITPTKEEMLSTLKIIAEYTKIADAVCHAHPFNAFPKPHDTAYLNKYIWELLLPTTN